MADTDTHEEVAADKQITVTVEHAEPVNTPAAAAVAGENPTEQSADEPEPEPLPEPEPEPEAEPAVEAEPEPAPPTKNDLLRARLLEAKEECADLRSYNFHLLRQVTALIRQNKGTLGLDEELASLNVNVSSMSGLAPDSNTSEVYEAVLEEVEFLHSEYSGKQQTYNAKIVRLNERVIESDEAAMALKNAYKNLKRKVCKSINKKAGTAGKIEGKWLLQKEEEEEELDNETEQERLKNIHYNINLRKLTAQIKEKDKLSDGLHLIDFEQLKIENQTLNEKIEERNDELYKLKKKITNTVQILTHIKEKLQFIAKINARLGAEQKEADAVVNGKRDRLSELKKKRDALRSKNTKLKQKQGFIANDVLVIDFQQTKNSLKSDTLKLEQAKHKYETLQKTIRLADQLAAEHEQLEEEDEM